MLSDADWCFVIQCYTRLGPQVRARIADVIGAAKQKRAVPWHKFHEGRWDQPGMGGKFSPLTLPPQGYMHGDAVRRLRHRFGPFYAFRGEGRGGGGDFTLGNVWLRF